MSFRFRKTAGLGRLARVNFSKSGASLSIGRRGASINLSPRYGTRATVGIPGSGVSYTTKLTGNQSRRARSFAEQEMKLNGLQAEIADYRNQRGTQLTTAEAEELQQMEATVEINRAELQRIKQTQANNWWANFWNGFFWGALINLICRAR
jgi:hypothetical protein